MKTLFKILRSIITSFLFITISIIIIIQFLFTVVRSQNIRLSELINRDSILSVISPNTEIYKNSAVYNTAINYIDDYINYVFYKRSYPTLRISELNISSEEEKRIITENFNELREKLDLDYETVLKIREINNFISNGSIYLLINILLFTLILILIIIKFNIKSSIKSFGIILIITSIFLLIGGSILYTSLINNNELIINLFFQEIINSEFITTYFNHSLIYIAIGTMFFIGPFLYSKLIKKINLAFLVHLYYYL